MTEYPKPEDIPPIANNQVEKLTMLQPKRLNKLLSHAAIDHSKVEKIEKHLIPDHEVVSAVGISGYCIRKQMRIELEIVDAGLGFFAPI